MPATNEAEKKSGDWDPTESRSLWFDLLELARSNNDSEGAAHARQELERLGVIVQYTGGRNEH